MKFYNAAWYMGEVQKKGKEILILPYLCCAFAGCPKYFHLIVAEVPSAFLM